MSTSSRVSNGPLRLWIRGDELNHHRCKLHSLIILRVVHSIFNLDVILALRAGYLFLKLHFLALRCWQVKKVGLSAVKQSSRYSVSYTGKWVWTALAVTVDDAPCSPN